MEVSGVAVADSILNSLQRQIQNSSLSPKLAVILAGRSPASRIYVSRKIKAAQKIGIAVDLFEFRKDQFRECKEALQKLDCDKNTHGIIIQYPVYQSWNFDTLIGLVNPQKDVDGFLPDSSFQGATALAVWEMLKAFANLEGFSGAEEFLKGKSVVLLGKGKTAGGPIRNLLQKRHIPFNLIDSKTENPDKIIKNADVVISATGKKHIITGQNLKKGCYVIGVGMGKELVDKKEKIFGDIEKITVSQKAKLYCPTIGGIGPLTIACLLRNVVESCKRFSARN